MYLMDKHVMPEDQGVSIRPRKQGPHWRTSPEMMSLSVCH